MPLVWTTMAERTSTGFLTMMLEPTPAVAMTLPAEVREKLAELELELSEGKLTTCERTTVWIKRTLVFPGGAINTLYTCTCVVCMTAPEPPPFIQALWLMLEHMPASSKTICCHQSFPKPNLCWSFLLAAVSCSSRIRRTKRVWLMAPTVHDALEV